MMTKRLPKWFLNDIQDQFTGKLFAFTPVVQRFGIGLGIAEANSAGYTPVPLTWFLVETWDEATAEADRLNTECLKLDAEASMRIVASSMAVGRVNQQETAT